MKIIEVGVSPSLLVLIDRASKDAGLSRSAWVRTKLIEALNRGQLDEGSHRG